jgi:hypothetical protein
MRGFPASDLAVCRWSRLALRVLPLFACRSTEAGLSTAVGGGHPATLLLLFWFKSRASTRPADERVTFFACPKKVTKEMPPGAALAASLRIREVMSGFARWTSVSIRELARLLRATLKGLSVMPSPRLTGTRDQKTDQEPYLRRRLLLGRARCALLCFSGSHYIAAAADDEARQGARDGSRAFRYCTRMCSQRNPAADADPSGRRPEGRNVLERRLLITFLRC